MPRIAAELEGVVESLPVKVGGNVEFHLLGIKVVVLPSAAARSRISTPTLQKSLSLDALASATPLPGRSEQGFLGCTAIVVGNYDTDAGVLEVAYPPTGADAIPAGAAFEHHPHLEIGPPETVLLGPSTSALGDPLMVAGVPVQVLAAADDPEGRLVPDDPTNEFGIRVDPRRIPPATLVSVDGYPSSDAGPRRIVGFAVVVDSVDPSTLLDRLNPQIGVTRAQGRNRSPQYDLEVRGGIFTGNRPGVSVPRRQRIEIKRVDGAGADEGSAPVVGFSNADAPPNSFAGWRFSERLTATREYPASPTRVKATYFNPPAGTPPDPSTSEVDVREDPDVPAA